MFTFLSFDANLGLFILTLVSAGAALVANFANMKSKTDRNSVEINSVRSELSLAIHDLHLLVTQINVLNKEQSIINQTTIKTLDSLVTKMERLNDSVLILETEVRTLKAKS